MVLLVVAKIYKGSVHGIAQHVATKALYHFSSCGSTLHLLHVVFWLIGLVPLIVGAIFLTPAATVGLPSATATMGLPPATTTLEWVVVVSRAALLRLLTIFHPLPGFGHFLQRLLSLKCGHEENQ